MKRKVTQKLAIQKAMIDAFQKLLIVVLATFLVSCVAKGRKNVSQTSALRRKSSDCQNWI
ncbi:hypothetical protein EI555_000961, partial [Monodon monoceros]